MGMTGLMERPLIRLEGTSRRRRLSACRSLNTAGEIRAYSVPGFPMLEMAPRCSEQYTDIK